MEEMDGSSGVVMEKPQKPKVRNKIRIRDILFTILVLVLAAANILVMLQAAGIIRYDRF